MTVPRLPIPRLQNEFDNKAEIKVDIEVIYV